MKKSILLVLLYLLIQLIAGTLVSLAITQWPTLEVELSVVIALLLANVIMAGILFYKGYLSDKQLINPTTPSFLCWTVVAGLSAIFISDAVASIFSFLPNWLESTFSNMEGSWLGVLAIAIVGPVLEEMLFRGAITTELLKGYSPKKAIIYSALIFGIFHINPAQVLNAFLIGLLLGWLFYKTRSLVPCIVIHILNNSLSVFFTKIYPDAETLIDVMGPIPYFICLAVAILLLILSIQLLKKKG
ncbi:MAG: CPBP family intramembrane metalloprotease [Bacteroidaceae bacterium]|nr:CPBP family intramembrane metalloprotease [Bacteroidaceae bacterium]